MEYVPEIDQGNVIISNMTILTVLTVTASTIGIFLSFLALFLLLLTAVLFAEWRQNYKNQLLIQFIVARFFYTIVRYFIDITVTFELYEVTGLVTYVKVFFIFYSEVALVFWMFVFTRQMYESLAKLFTAPRRSIWYVSAITWSIPMLITIAFYIPLIQNFGTIKFITPYFLTVKWPILIVNAILLIRTVKAILITNKSSTERNVRIVVFMIILIFNFSLQLVIIDIFKLILTRKYYSTDEKTPLRIQIGLIVYNILMLYHCASATFFWLFGNKQTRTLWRFRAKSIKNLTPQNSLGLRLSSNNNK